MVFAQLTIYKNGIFYEVHLTEMSSYLIWLQWRTDVKIDGGSLLLRLPSSSRLILHQRQGKLFLVFLIIIALKQK